MFKQFVQTPDMVAVMPNSTSVRAQMYTTSGSKLWDPSKRPSLQDSFLSTFSLDDLRILVVPDFIVIGGDAAAELTDTYYAHTENALLPLSQMDKCPLCQALDKAITAALGLEEETVGTIRRGLAAEPSIDGWRYSVWVHPRFLGDGCLNQEFQDRRIVRIVDDGPILVPWTIFCRLNGHFASAQ